MTTDAGVLYEVELEIDAGIRDAWLRWLDGHVREIVALPGFTGAEAAEVVDPPSAPGTCTVCVRYRLVDGAALQAYLRDHAPRMRADGVARFGERMRARRRVLARLAIGD